MSRTPEEALRLAISALRGEKAVGSTLRPEINPAIAGQWVSHCLDPERREKLSMSQMVFIFTQAKAIGAHDGFEALAHLCGYRVTSVMDPMDEIADMARRAEEAAKVSGELSREVIERMRAAHLKV